MTSTDDVDVLGVGLFTLRDRIRPAGTALSERPGAAVPAVDDGDPEG